MLRRLCSRRLAHPRLDACQRWSSTVTVADINPHLVSAEYAVRGAIVLRSAEIKRKLKENPDAFPFDKVVECNIGNPQALQQQPLSFNRQVLALMAMPAMMDWPDVQAHFPLDAIERAREYLREIPQGIGAYSESQGFDIVRSQVASFIEERDGVATDKSDIFLTDGASKGVQMVLKMLLRDSNDGVLVPVPQYPLYSATLALEDAKFVGYLLSEENNWSMPVQELTAVTDAAAKKGAKMRALVVINPGNPTGNALPVDNMEEIINFCSERGLVLMADEVYQENVYAEGSSFTSFKKVLKSMKPEPPLQLVSFHSTSKGFLGECGLRGGYMELVGLDPDVKGQLLKLASIGLCSNTVGQLATGLMVQPPKPGSASYETYAAEREGIMSSLKRRANKLVAALNQLEGVSCNEAQGAMYAFPQITFSDAAIVAAEAAGQKPDAFYTLQLLENTGIVVVPGSGFGQRDGTWHFRTTFLPPEADMDGVIQRMSAFHSDFLKKYA